ncbi:MULTISPECIES: O-antigen ligase family protein [Butyricimonas]|uniref:O-antigen ligase family protein n=1 Tax=Butyricimonas TaxID=574697 RepID=UPI0007FB24EB|nr:O-antigen ligase family protein [Butyricimonas synergistica]
MKKINVYRSPLFLDLLLWFAFFIVIGSACFQFQYKFPFTFELFSILSKVIFIVSLSAHIVRCLKYRRKFFSKFDFFLLLLLFWLVYSSILNKHSWITQIPFVMKALAVRYLFSLYMPNHTEKATKILSSVFSFIIYANFFQLLFFPSLIGSFKGEYIYLISTNYNQFAAVFMPAIFLHTIMYFRTGRIRSLILLLSVCFASVALEGSATATVSILLLLLTVIFIKNERLLKIENLSLIVGIVFFFFTFVIPTFSVLDIPLVSNFVEGLGKDMTFSHRTNIWRYAEFQIIHSPIIGYGVCDKEWFQHLLSNAVHTHNIVLQMLLQGGIIGLLIFAVFVYGGIKKILSVQNKYQKRLLITVSIIFLLMSQFEVYINTFIYIFIFLMFVTKNILISQFIEK